LKHYHLDGLWDGSHWIEPAIVAVDDSGRIRSIANELQAGGEVIRLRGYALPGFQNAHSHAFQYAMAGCAEFLRGPSDDFWSWREAMYRLALSVTPEDMEAIAAMLYAEMLRHGYTHVAEFHYLHHDKNGQPYNDLAAMGRALIRAAETTGIQLTLIPMYYNRGGFGQEPAATQRRFISKDRDAYWRLIEATGAAAKVGARARIGVGLHSLRAATPVDTKALVHEVPKQVPFHIHIAEQQKEVTACFEHFGERPVTWLLNQVPVDQRFHLVHATHVNEEEWRGIINSGAHVVLCPSTEGNLGDGFFPLQPFHAAGGRWSIGTDSHVGLSPMEELRWLDYGQRLRMEKRNILAQTTGDDSGVCALERAWRSGRAAMGMAYDSPFFATGQLFDAVVFDAAVPLLATLPQERRVSVMLYASDSSQILATISAGQCRVEGGRHHLSPQLQSNFVKAMQRLYN
jgi:formimidoylglutamate deiminase